jgi:hypothetical protein
MNDAARWPVLHDVLSSRARALSNGAVPNAWLGAPDSLSLVLDSAELPSLVAQAASWAERITLCVTAPESEHGSSPWWRELLARNTKCDAVYVRRAEQAESWLLQRLHAAGRLRLVEGGGKQVASNLLVFARGSEVRVLLSHIPLERAAAGAAFGALLSFRGASGAELARACRAQVESWAELARIPTGSELDALMLDPRRREPAPGCSVPASPRVLVGPAEIAARLGSWAADDTGVSVRSFTGGHRLSFERRGEALAPLTLTLHAGPGWAAGNALLVDSGSGDALLVWRGGLLGHARARSALAWSETRAPSFQLEDAALGLSQRVAVVARASEPLGPQLLAFARELTRLTELFGVQPAPALGHVLADFAELSDKQQTLLVYRALLGLGALELEVAARTAAEVLRDQGYLRGEDLSPGSARLVALAGLIAQAADCGRSFDRPSPDHIRAIQPDLGSFVQDDWLACLLDVLPENQVVAQRTALRLAFERARDAWGLTGERLRRHGPVERALDSCLSNALCRGLVLRVGAGGLARPGRAAVARPRSLAASESAQGFLAGWSLALESLSPAQRFLITRRAGWYGRRETIESVAQRVGLTLERARQIESETWAQIEAGSAWAETLRARLQRALEQARFVCVRQLTLDDAWWQGVEQHLGLAEAAFESLLGGEVGVVELGPPGERQAFFARFGQAELDRAFEGLLERAAQVPTPASIHAYRAPCEAAAASLDAALCEPFCDALEARLELDPDEPTSVVRFSESPRALEPLPIEPRAVDSEALLRLEDVLRSVFRTAGTPLSLSAVSERVRKRLDVDEATLAQRLASAPFVERNVDQYGLLARDVPGGHEAIATVLNDVAEALAARQRALTAAELWSLAEARVKRAWSAELVRSLIGNDPALYLSPTHATSLRRWQHARSLSQGAPICPGVPASVRPRFEKLAQQPLPAPEALRQRVSSELGRLERTSEADDALALPLARQLCDLSERLLEHAAAQPSEVRQLTHAAIGCLLEALAPDEESIDAPAVHAGPLADARAVFAAVLRWLELDWLEGAPPSRRPPTTEPLSFDESGAVSAQSGTPTRYNAPSPSLEM